MAFSIYFIFLVDKESETKYRTLYEAMQRLKNQAQSKSKEQDYETLQRKAKDLETQKQQLNTVSN